MSCLIYLVAEILLWEQSTCIYFLKTVGKKQILWYVVSFFPTIALMCKCDIPKINVLTWRLIWNVLFFCKETVILEKVLSQMLLCYIEDLKKGWQIQGFFQILLFFKKHNDWRIGGCVSELLIILDNILHFIPRSSS